MADPEENIDDAPEVIEAPGPEWTEDDAAEAKAFGWKAPEEWAGEKPRGYIDDPRRYLERAETFRPFKVLRDRTENLERDFQERFRKLESASSATIISERARYDREIATIQQGKRDAVDTADREMYDRLEKQQASLSRPYDAPPPASQPIVQDTFVQEYAKANDWVNNPILREAGAKLIEAGGYANRPAKDQIEYAEREVRRMYPNMFAPVAAAQPAPMQMRVDGGGLGGGAKGGAFAKLPTEAKSAFKKFVGDGIFQDTEVDRKRYADDYDNA